MQIADLIMSSGEKLVPQEFFTECGLDIPIDWCDILNNYILANYSRRELFGFIQNMETAHRDIKLWLYSNAYNINTLYSSIVQEYNPIENYNRTEETTHAITGSSTDTKDSTLTTQAGERNTSYTDSFGKIVTNNSDTAGEIVSISETTNKVAPEDSETFYNNNKSTANNTQNAVTNTSTNTRDAVTNSGTAKDNSYTDTNTNSGVDTNEHKENVTITSKITGNIGVTTSQQMLLSQRELANLNLIHDIAHGIVVCISMSIWTE